MSARDSLRGITVRLERWDDRFLPGTRLQHTRSRRRRL